MAEDLPPDIATGPGAADVLVSVIVPVHGGAGDLDQCLTAIHRSDWATLEVIVIDDASPASDVAAVIERHGVRHRRIERRSGPAAARNAGAELARGEILFFTDADVVLHTDAIAKAVSALQSDPELSAVIGSYDDTPAHPSLLSRYRNLFHHWNHQVGREQASTFWSGCGAIRRTVFAEAGGFNADYREPSVEDIELGYRIRQTGHRIRLHKAMLATHLKRWRFGDMIRTDIFRRGVPWTALLLQHRSAPPDLNLNRRARVATVAAALFPIACILAIWQGGATALLPTLILLAAAAISGLANSFDTAAGAPMKRGNALVSASVWIGVGAALAALIWTTSLWALVPLGLIVVVVTTQRAFYRLLADRGGPGFAFAAIPLQLLFFISCAVSVPLGWLSWLGQRQAGRKH
ncbi:glycosyltransferase [Elongatibacter sediminis]